MIVLNMVNTIAMFAYMLWWRKSLSVSDNPTKNLNSLIFLMTYMYAIVHVAQFVTVCNSLSDKFM